MPPDEVGWVPGAVSNRPRKADGFRNGPVRAVRGGKTVDLPALESHPIAYPLPEMLRWIC